MLKFDNLPNQITQKIEHDRTNGVKNPYAFCDGNAIRRKNNYTNTLSISEMINAINNIQNEDITAEIIDDVLVISKK